MQKKNNEGKMREKLDKTNAMITDLEITEEMLIEELLEENESLLELNENFEYLANGIDW